LCFAPHAAIIIMDIDLPPFEETERRYQERQSPRSEHQQKLQAGQVLQADTPHRVKKRLQRLGVKGAQVEQLMQPAKVLDRATTDFSKGVSLERILETNDLQPIAYLAQGTQVAQSIGRVQIRNAQRVRGYGTGFLVSSRLLLTNNHVLPSLQSARFSQIEFNYQNDRKGEPQPSVMFNLSPEELFLTDRALDYTLVAVNPQSASGEPLDAFAWLPLIEAEGKVIIGEFVNIIQHPSGEKKQIALRENVIIDVLSDFLHYQTDTAPGSSGSPVFNDQWEVVALHHSGVPKRNEQGQVLAKNGQIWTPDDGETEIDWLANEGVRISRIIQHIQQQPLSPLGSQLRNQLFAPPAEALMPSSLNHAPQSMTNHSHPNVASDGTVQWTIPLQVSVRLGEAMLPVPPVPAIPTPPAVVTPPPIAPSLPPIVQPTPDELDQYLAEARRASSRTYYDRVADGAQRDRYYQAIVSGLTGLSTIQFYRQLSTLVRDTHRNRLNYKPVRDLYPWVDLHPNGKIQSIYSKQEFDPEELIREDFRVEQIRATRLLELAGREGQMDAVALEQSLNLLEAELPYNCEHVVPQSWFNKREPMKGDLHHLFACEVNCNSYRSNHPYIDFPDYQEAIRDRCGKLDGNNFEPENGKGIVARAVLYFLLRYPGEINSTDREYRAQRLNTLLDWHKQFPVEEYERHRNAAIFEKQGNRNPLIDFPDWVDKIDFRQGLGT
jgi:endonuclease G, mitochondrial